MRGQISIRVVRRHAPAGVHLPSAHPQPEPPAHGRAVRRARCADARPDEPRPAVHLVREQEDRPVRDSLDSGSGVPGRPGVRHGACTDEDPRVDRDQAAATARSRSPREPGVCRLHPSHHPTLLSDGNFAIMTVAESEHTAGGGRAWLRTALDRYGTPLAIAVTLFAVWELGVRLGNVPAYLLPPPTAVFASLVNDWKVIYLNITPTLIAIVGGFALSVVIGIPLATVIVFSRFAERMLYPPMIASQAIPKVAIAPLFIVWMGFGVMPKVWIRSE